MMKEIVHIKTSEIEDVILHNPELFCKKAKSLIIKEYNKIQKVKKDLQYYRDKVRTLEEEYKNLNSLFNKKNGVMFSLIFKEEEKEVHKNNSSIMIAGHGNDIIGITNKI